MEPHQNVQATAPACPRCISFERRRALTSEVVAALVDAGRCTHVAGPQNPRTLSGIPVSCETRVVSGGMVCDNWKEVE